MTAAIRCSLFVLLLPGLAAAQDRPAAPTPPTAEAPPAPIVPAPKLSPIEPQGYTYNAAGRRDPFVSLLRRGVDPASSAAGSRPPGLPGLAAAEVSLRGTIAAREGYVAIVQGVDNKTYIVRAGDKLRDGTIRTITAGAMVIVQKVNDPLSPQKEREVRKLLRQTEEAK